MNKIILITLIISIHSQPGDGGHVRGPVLVSVDDLSHSIDSNIGCILCIATAIADDNAYKRALRLTSPIINHHLSS